MGMIERVARAMAAKTRPPRAVGEDDWGAYVPLARAAIAAMREPTEAMRVAGHNMRSDPKTGMATLCGTDEIYTAMIDAALSPLT